MESKDGLERTQPQVIDVDQRKCVNCHACISACPVKFCNDGSGSHVKVDPNTCIGCGNCLRACLHQARRYLDDFAPFMADLEKGVRMVAIVAPSAAASFPETYMNLVGWLKSRGIEAVFDVSFGAELAAKSMVEFVRRNDPRLVIAQPCPAIVTFVQVYHPELLPYLAPIDSPMLHTMKMIRARYPQFADCRIAAISPCAAKKREFAETGYGDYNVTFESLAHYFQEHQIDLSGEPEGAFANPPAEGAVRFSMPGGLLSTAQRWMPELAERTRKIEGSPIVYNYLRRLPEVVAQDRTPLLVDCLSCEFGCNAGPAALSTDRPPDEIEYWIERRCREIKSHYECSGTPAGDDTSRDIDGILSDYWQHDLYTRGYADLKDRNRIRVPDEKTRWVILSQMHKYSESDLYNCTACGYLSCEGMATAIYNGKNKPENCHFYLAKEREISHREMIEREKRFRNILTTCIEGFVSVDNDFVITEVNPALCRMLQMGPDRIVGRGLHEFTDEAGQKELDHQLELLRAGNSSVYEISLIRGNGQTIHCIFSASPIRDGNNRRIGSFAMVTDNTARKQAEHELRRTHDELEQRVRERTSELARTNEDLHVEIVERKRAESIRRLNELRLEAVLQLHAMREQSIQAITDFALENAVIITESRIGYLAFLNDDESVLTMYSWSKSAMAECAIVDKPIIYPLHTTGLWGEAVRQRKPVITNDYSAPNPHKKGTPPGHVALQRHMNIPVFDGDKIVAVAGVGNKASDYDEMDVRQMTLLMNGMWDLIRRKRAQEALRAAKEAAEAATRAKSEFLAVMSHEIRTPMSGVLGLLDILLKSQMGPEQRQYVQMASDNAQSLLVILEDILDSSRIESGRLALEAVPFSPLRVFSGAIESLRVRAESKGLRIGCDISPDVPKVLVGDPTRLRQVIVNLVGNAIKFTERGGIEVLVRCDSRTADEAMVRTTVKDSGIGIAPEAQRQLFQSFQQADTSTTRRYGGTGLGLFICKSLVEMMRGTIHVDSALGRGSTFTFTIRLPLGRETNAGATASSHEPPEVLPRHSARLRILCAEDNVTNQTIVRILVERMGHQIDLVANGQEAVDALSARPYDVALMDVRMPVMDGYGATGIIRNRQSSVLDHDLYVIALTANALKADRDCCLAAGMNDYVRKPIDEARLHAALSRAIEYQQGRHVTLSAMPSAEGAVPPPSDEKKPVSRGSESDSPSVGEDEAGVHAASRDVADQFSPEVWREIAGQYLQDAPERIEQMKAALKGRDAEMLSRAAHTLKSSSHYVRAPNIGELGAVIEQMADRGEFEGVELCIAKLEAGFERLKSQLLASGDIQPARKDQR
ncbi:MAG TPA: ATP-binding protein [Phycisphaerae bacterium]|nr:ATP-binding protein [Phycisphaerae bacterium]